MLDDDDALMVSLVTAAGFVAEPGQGAAAWMQAHSAPTISPLPEGYSLASRADMGAATHHFADRTGPHVADRLEQTSLYRPDLDLVVLDTDGEPAAYGLFWHDPTTEVGCVEPMGTNKLHRRRGLARHVLTSGIHRLVESGASRIKINYETGNPASRSLYLDVGFIPAMTTSLYVRTPLVSPTEFTLRTL
jgi:predicted N-acetyltransferase YhbS